MPSYMGGTLSLDKSNREIMSNMADCKIYSSSPSSLAFYYGKSLTGMTHCSQSSFLPAPAKKLCYRVDGVW